MYQNTFNPKPNMHIYSESDNINGLNNIFTSKKFKYRHFSVGNIFNNNINRRGNSFYNSKKYLSLDLNKL